MIDRRWVLAGGMSALGALAAPAVAQTRDLLGDDGKVANTWRLPSEVALDRPGVIAAGGKAPDVILYEFFDYNCPWCKKSEPDLARLVSADRNFSLRLVQNPILSLGSVQASKIVLAVQALAGDAQAYALHRVLLGHRGPLTGPDALAAVKQLKLDLAAVEARADDDATLKTLRVHTGISRALGMEATPSFAINGMGIGGWPGAQTIARVVGAVRACDLIVC